MERRSLSTPTSAPPVDTTMPLVLETRLANGIRVVTLDRPAASEAVVVTLRLQTGSSLDHEREGLARFTGAMLTRGSGGRSIEEIADELDGLGATLSVGVSGEATDGSTKSLREHANQVVGLLAEALRNPDFPEEQVEIVRGQMLSSYRQLRQSTSAEADRLMREALYPLDHPYHRQAGGTDETLPGIDRGALIDFHTQTYQPGGAIAAVAGGISHQEAVDLITRHFGDWTGDTVPIRIPLVEPLAEHVRVDEGLAGKSQADISLGQTSLARSHPDYYALSLANLILGRFGLYGRLGERIRERQGLAYYAYSNLEVGKRAGVWLAKAGVAPENVDRAITSIIEETERFQSEGPTELEFQDAVGHLVGLLPLRLETSGGMAGTALDIAWQDLGHDYLQRYRGIIQRLTPQEVTAAALRHLTPSNLAVAVVGPLPETA
jgi:zinc protease